MRKRDPRVKIYKEMKEEKRKEAERQNQIKADENRRKQLEQQALSVLLLHLHFVWSTDYCKVMRM